MSKTFLVIVSVQMGATGPIVTEVPTGTGLAGDGMPTGTDPTGSHGQGTPLLTAMLQSGKWSIQSIQQLGQQSASGALVNVFLLVFNG